MKIKLPANKYLRGILTIIGAIIIGAVGSGLWEIGLRPLSISSRDFILNMISLGAQSLRDDIYSRIAYGYDQSPSILLLEVFVAASIVVMFLYYIKLYFEIKNVSTEYVDMLKKIDDELILLNSPKQISAKKESSESIKAKLITYREKLTKRSIKSIPFVFYQSIFLSFLLATLLVITVIKTSYINSAISHYNQLMTIAAPYLNKEDSDLLGSQFSQIKNRDDYVKVLSKLETCINGHNIIHPKFSVW